MKKHNELLSIIEEPKSYLDFRKRDLEKRLGEIELSEEKTREIKNERSKALVKSKALSLLGAFGEVITTIIDWNEGVNEDITEAKKSMLIARYMDKADEHQASIEQLKQFLVNPQGNTLFNKILRILDDSPPDGTLIEHLSSTLKFIIENGEFETLFDIHKFSLSQIEKLSPQALSILSDYKNWPLFTKYESFMDGDKVREDFHNEFAQKYCEVRGVNEQTIVNRVSHSIFELKRAGLIDARRKSQGNGTVSPILTTPGREITLYLTVNEEQ